MYTRQSLNIQSIKIYKKKHLLRTFVATAQFDKMSDSTDWSTDVTDVQGDCDTKLIQMVL